ncbi:MipA/OmpV family protein [Paucibacter sp. B2R-40]|uniref:MipA/OmpV family protein n=1 Tax=Paucibacter sp. B2R-40 TaxID=2893554 RepID=UPI0021E498B2|nr:MipA/OmpV family protein [Paucibacter sp. B2R-40]MCV2355741.1 MipA/OmpV family protein [Paucibacter sp. B2R-40]
MYKSIPAFCLGLLLMQAAQADDLLGIKAMLGDTARSPVPGGWTVGGVAYTGSSVYKDGPNTTLPIPGGIYIGKDFMYLGDRAFYTFARQGSMQLYGRLRLRLGNLDPADTSKWDGMEKRKGQLEAGLGFGLVSDVGLWTARFSSDVSGRSKGTELLFNWSAPLVHENWMVMPGLGAMWRQDKLANYYFGGVSAAEAAPGRPAYSVGHAWSLVPSMVASYRINPQWLIGGILSADVFSDRIKNSPLVQQRARYDILLGVGYVWR